jgi:alkylation response protein AidB-like acyl-CoA dehydrogenase
MSIYEAPLRDIKFVLNDVVGLSEVTSLPGCGDVTPELADAVFAEAARFARDVLAPLNDTGDRAGARFADGVVTSPPGFRDAYQSFIAAGWNGLGADPEFGGQGLPHVIAMPVQEMWNSANMAFCLAPMLTSGVIETLGRHGSPGQRKAYLEALTSGRWTGTMNLTEPQAGSDLSAIETRAERGEDHFLLHGSKIFITWGEHDLAENIVHLVLARIPGAPDGVRGISLFIVPRFLPGADGAPDRRNDVRCISLERKLGIHASPTCLMRYGEQGGAAGYLVGEENHGLEYMFTMMNHARVAVGIEGVGIAERAYQHALAYARVRIQGRPAGARSGERVAIIRHPDVRRMLWSMRSRTDAMRLLAYWTAAGLDKAKRHPDPREREKHQMFVDLLTPVVKAWCTGQAVDIASTGVQIHGGMGYVEDGGAAQFLRDARVTTIYEGTNGIQAGDLVARKVGADRGTTAGALIMHMRQNSPAAAPALAGLPRALESALDDLEASTRHVVQACISAPDQAAAVAVPYLDLFGITVAGWLMVRSAAVAAAALADHVEDAAYFEGKLAASHYFSEHVLVTAGALRTIVTEGAGSILAASSDFP